MKHVIEPSFSIQRTTLIDNYDRIAKLESVDYVTGGVTRFDYGLTNRLLAKRRATRQARELLSLSVFQSYYTDEFASQFDPSYGTSFTGRAPSSFSPLTISARTLPTDGTSANVILGKQFEQVVTQLHANYYTACYRGNMFIGVTAAAGVVPPIYNNTAQTFMVWNPTGSGKYVVPVGLRAVHHDDRRVAAALMRLTQADAAAAHQRRVGLAERRL